MREFLERLDARAWSIGCLLVLGAAMLPANEAAGPAHAAGAGRFEPLAFLAGSCWSGRFLDRKAEDTHCFRWVYGTHFLRDVHVVRSAKPDYHGETIYWWDAAQSRLRYVYWNSNGGVSEGHVAVEDGVLRFPEERLRGRDGKEQVYRSVWRREGADGFTAVTELQSPQGWKEAWRVTFRRAGPSGE